jgi:hypothetical protein
VFRTLWCSILVGAVFSSQALAQNATSSGPSVEQSVEELLTRQEEFDSFGWPAEGRFNPFPATLEKYISLNQRLWNDFGFSYFYKPTLMTQASGRPNNNLTTNFQHNILAYWRMVENDEIGTLALVGSVLQVRQISSTNGIQFMNALGMNFSPSDSVTDVDALKALYLRHDLPGGIFNYRVGQVELSGVQGSCNYACDDTSTFFSGPLSAFPANSLPGQGMGFIGEAHLTGTVSIEAGIADARGDGTVDPSRPFDTNEWAYAGALIVDNPFADIGDGRARLAYYHVGTTQKDTTTPVRGTDGLAFIYEQDIGDHGYFLKAATAWGRQAGAAHTAAGGMVWKKPFGYEEDRWGLGIGWVSPSANNTNDEYVAETYYRMQLTPTFQGTLGLMAVINPSNISSNLEGVANFRVQAHW